MNYHEPVMLKEVIDGISISEGKKYIDCTLGDGGHSLEILKRGGTVLGIDVDGEAIKRAKARIEQEGLEKNFKAAQGNFKNIENLAIEQGFDKVNGILYDLGYSSYQLTVQELGISFLEDQSLDMRLDKNLGVTAADLVNALPEQDLTKMFFELSDERYSKRFARAIVERRDLKKFQTTKELADLLVSAAPSDYEHGRINPATRVFQALRIAVNDEIDNLLVSLPRAARLLLPGGRIAVISFHSLEDKTVKDFGRNVRPVLKQITEKPLIPEDSEVEKNSRSRSAKLRIYEKLPEED